jgi:uncharacterized protein (DUF433 family)
MSKEIDWKKRIHVDPAVLAGRPTIRGLRISVEHVLRVRAGGLTPVEILRDYPDLEADDLRACLAYAADAVAVERVYPVEVGA